MKADFVTDIQLVRRENWQELYFTMRELIERGWEVEGDVKICSNAETVTFYILMVFPLHRPEAERPMNRG